MGAQRIAFGQALTWLLGELIEQRAQEPVAFLAQLGRDHRKYGVTQSPLRHHAGRARLRAAQPLRRRLGRPDRRGRPRRGGADDRGERGAADAEDSPPFCDGTVVDHIRPTRDVSIVRLQLDQALFTTPASTSPSRSRSGRDAGAT